jgi:tetratricopeptide (TPR) repeat protein
MSALRFSAHASALVFLTAFLNILGAAPAADSQSEVKAPELGKVKSIAESQHEIVMLLFEKKEFNKALTEANKIFQMDWPENQEAILLKELLYLSDRFMHSEQSPLGLRLLETNQRMFRKAASQAAIWKEKGYLYKKMNQPDKALDCFREAQRLDKSRSN